LSSHCGTTSLIRIDNKPVFDKQLFLHGISKVKDLIKESCNFLSLEDFIETYKIKYKKNIEIFWTYICP